jgi:regulatory protein
VNELRQKALKLLARRDHSRVELTKKLGPLGTPEEIASVLDQLQQSGLLSDARATAAYLRGHGARFGAAKLKHALHAKGIDSETVEAELANADLPGEIERARLLWRRKFGNRPLEPGCRLDPREWARQARFLQSRGFSSEVVRKLLKDPENEDAGE